MEIINSTKNDIDIIFEFYDAAIAYQKTKFYKHWQGFDYDLVQTEIKEHRQWKIMMGNTIVCVFAITFNDPVIWGEKDTQPSIYIHRIVTHPSYRGNSIVKDIVVWAKVYCKENNREFIRLDTWGDNQKLIDYYTSCGFKFLGVTDTIQDMNLPKHYDCISLSLFEIAITGHEQPV